MGEAHGNAAAAMGGALMSPSVDAVLISTDSKKVWLMALAGRRTAATVASPVQISRPANSSAHHRCCGMDWLDNAACGFGPYIDRGINDAAPG